MTVAAMPPASLPAGMARATCGIGWAAGAVLPCRGHRCGASSGPFRCAAAPEHAACQCRTEFISYDNGICATPSAAVARPCFKGLLQMMKRQETALRAAASALLVALPLCCRAQFEVDTMGVDSMVVVADAPRGHSPVLRFGYVSYETALKAMPDYAAAGKRVEELRAKYAAEERRAADEFNAKYEEFLDGQAGFPPTILHKRQAELQDLLERNVAFKEESRRLMEAAERDIYAPLHRRLRAAIRTVGRQNGYAFVINIDGNACPFIDSSMGDNVTLMVIDMLK